MWVRGFKPWFLCFAALLLFCSPSASLLTIRNSKRCHFLIEYGRHGVSLMQSSVMLLKHQECICLRLNEPGLLYFSAPAPPIELSAEVAESLPSLSPSFKPWGWHAVRLMRKFIMLRAIVSDLQMTQAVTVPSALAACTLTLVHLVHVPSL